MSTPSSQKVFTKDQTVLRDGLIYHQDTNEPVNGIVEMFHPNGQSKVRGNHIDGKSDGLWKYFYENGQLNMRGNYIDGKQNGPFETFYENGELWERGNYRDGVENGLWEHFHENGQLSLKRDGLWEIFDPNGNLIETKTYRNGEAVESNMNP